jgi:Ti-type conjugative transfer relaxase TraA
MAIYHLHANIIQRSKGQSAVACAAYRRAEKLFDEREQKTWNYSSKQHVIHSDLVIPENAPEWAKELSEDHAANSKKAIETLWNKVEKAEVRIDAQLAREFEFALPIELNQEQCIALAQEFISDQFALRGMIADWSVHWEKNNPHVHVMTTLRELTPDGFGNKVRAWNSKEILVEWRGKWAEYANFHLRQHGYEVKIDHRSYEEQGIALTPTLHQGKAVRDMDVRGIHTDIVAQNNKICIENLDKIFENPAVLLDKMVSQRESFNATDISSELGRYINDKGLFRYETPHSDNLHVDSQEVITPDFIVTLLESIEKRESVFTEKDLTKALEPLTENASKLSDALTRVMNSPELISLGAGDDGRDRYTTQKMFAIENDIQNIADELGAKYHIKIAARKIDSAIESHEKASGNKLTQEQRRAVAHILKPQSISCLVGRAGTGKSFSLGAARAVWEANHQRVIGIALSGVAADGLSNDAGIDGRTIESFLYALKTGSLELNARDVVVMDEAGMTDSVGMQAVMAAVQAATAKLVLVGDHAQLQPVGPGAAFRALVERLGFAEIFTVYRQKEEWQREATVLFSAGNAEQALDAYHEKGLVHFGKDHESACQQLVNDWISHYETHQGDLSDYLVIAHRNQDVLELNTQLRNTRIERGHLSPGYQIETDKGEIHIAQTDRILFLKNDKTLGVKNGRFATVKSVRFSESGKVIDFVAVLDGKNKQEVLINPKEYNSFAHGYAATGHKTQGATFNHTFVYTGGWMWDRCLTYVAMTRHRLTCRLYANKEIHADLPLLKKNLARAGSKDSALDFPLAFALRRGIDVTNLVSHLPAHLSKKLHEYKDKLVARYENYQSHGGLSAQNNPLSVEKAEQFANDFMRREDAREVARYKDLNTEMGASYAALHESLQSLGFSKISYEPNDIAIISQTTEYQAFQSSLKALHRQAAVLMESPEKYELAIRLHQIDEQKLASQAQKHICYARVQTYLDYRNAEKSAARDAQALILMNDIKNHYGAIRELNVETKQLRAHAMSALKIERFAVLSPTEQAALSVVERYQTRVNGIGAYYGQIKQAGAEGKDAVHNTEKEKEIQGLMIERNKLASQILSGGKTYSPALTFMQIGEASALFAHDKITPETEIKSQQRLEKMKNYAASHHRFLRVEKYFASEEGYEKRKLAFEIVENAKLHHGALIHFSPDTKAAWRVLRREAKLFEREQFIWKLHPDKREIYRMVDGYVEAKRASGRAWRAVFENKAAANLSDEAINKQLQREATECMRVKEAYAQKISSHLPVYREALFHYGIEEKSLQKEGASYRHYALVQEYAQKEKGMSRFTLASIIASNPKAHHAAILEMNLNWRTIYRDVRHYERHEAFKKLSREEKRFHRLVSRYQETNRAAGQLFAKTKAAHYQAHDAMKPRLTHHFAKRDYLAWELTIAAKQIGEGYLESQAETLRLKVDKLKHQYEKHADKLHRVAQYQAARETGITAIEKGCQWMRQELHESSKQKMDEGMRLLTASSEMQKTRRLYSSDMEYALYHYGLSQIQLDSHSKTLDTLKRTLPLLAATQGIQLTPVSTEKKAIKEGRLSLPSFSKHVDIAWLRNTLNEQTQAVALHYLGNPTSRHGHAWRYGTKGSLSVTLQGSKCGRWYDFQAGEGGDMLSLIQRTMGAGDFKMVLDEALRFVGGESRFVQQAASTSKSFLAADEKTQKLAKAREIASQTVPIAGTLAERYLREHRAISADLNENIRFHPSLYHPLEKAYFPALVVVSRNADQQVCAVQSISLNKETAQKASIETPKITRGMISEESSAVLIQKGKGQSPIVALAEGPETALSISSAKPEWTVYATLGSANFARAPLSDNTQKVLICADNDGDNKALQKTLDKATSALSQKGFDVWMVKPKEIKADFNDILMKQGAGGVKEALAGAVLLQKGIRTETILNTIETQIKSLNSPQEMIKKLQSKAGQQGGIDNLSEKEREALLDSFKKQFEQKNPELTAKVKAEMNPSPSNQKEVVIDQKTIDMVTRYKEMAKKAESVVEKATYRMQQEVLSEYAYRLSKQPAVMNYLKKHDENTAKQIEQLSRTYQQELSYGRSH